MFANLLENITGRDDLERVAHKENLEQLNVYLKSRKVLIPRRPRRFLDANSFTQDQLMEMIRKDLHEMKDAPFEPWILELDGKKRLPAFSSQKKMQEFSSKISQQLNKVFPLGGAEVLLDEITKGLDIDFVDLNLFSEKSREIGMVRHLP